MFSTDSLLAFIGRSPAGPEMDEWLSQQRIRHRPFTAEEDECFKRDSYRAGRNARASEVDEVERHSLALIYDRKALYWSLVGKPDEVPPLDPGPFVLREVAFFASGFQNYRGYEGELPAQLRFGQSSTEAIQLLGDPLARRKVRDLICLLWAVDDWILNASFLEGDDDLGVVHIRRQNMYDRRMLGKDRQRDDNERGPADMAHKAVGRSLVGPIAGDALASIGWAPNLFDLSNAGEITHYMPTRGVTLYVGDRGQAPSVLTGIRFNRRGDMGSEGFDGRMPHQIEFHDTPAVVEARVGRRPDKITQAPDTGAYLWHMGKYDLHVMFSLIDYQVYRTSLFMAT
ncbi:hypothetical protein [Roseateles amylovorans]|uniref:Uncharacterized protein n=1 Tax=Roseateles amylovorans TaxID=2978473 RepID=A0ABY6BBR6_9BURK|nr:hypothetical protein [Roseateles amylovorans]UXH80632.1 hypothetical protein N4261_12450 [Roseateles amylovorans]